MITNPGTPTAIKAAKGTLQPCRVNHDEPDAIATDGEPPAWLSDKAAEAYRELADDLMTMRVLSDADRHALGVLCDTWAEYREACRQRDRLLRVGDTDAWLKVLSKLEAHRNRLTIMLREFGLTPASRAKVKVIGGKTVKDNPWARHATTSRSPKTTAVQ